MGRRGVATIGAALHRGRSPSRLRVNKPRPYDRMTVAGFWDGSEKPSEYFTPSAARGFGHGGMAGRKMPAGTPALPGASPLMIRR